MALWEEMQLEQPACASVARDPPGKKAKAVPSSGMPTGMSENEASTRRTLMLRIGRKLRHLLGRLPLGDDLSRIRHTPLE
jgi:hypothetical protein